MELSSGVRRGWEGASKVRWSDGSMGVVEKWASEDDVWRVLIVWG